ncbi:MAG: Diaminohydroxyphosphoribosylaminopyrimidine deaminase / 5-amino-6-(5-phosphoribosylamino)uracil reductase [uncultured Nocardioidaceae bacterium]|uniref:Riboflavin biosynthesis protein RibD n=1 Tax=uncultured Nocardioidaceae bacterium TaxID=253824 RepID=A0A6J4LX96_9ACTN|nr:MAG: Diaminohydroxyphosphoribosylaminopyrimidine deaminase / 5-amino-6-(5-phosphoribosylamino)uracil reductase [uncultured Nocardioidaceae bacterium]
MPHASPAELAAMRRALEVAGTPGTPLGPNPRVGCVLLDPDGNQVAEGHHRGAGNPHAEVEALRALGRPATGLTAVVTLEPCNHTGRTGPCATALLEAGVARVVHAQSDPNPVAAGGAATLRAAGVEVESGVLEREARELNRAWTFGLQHGRPLVTWKYAATLDGRSAAADGSSRWISSPAARRDTHRLRARSDAVLVGTGTVLDDDPQLTARDEDDRSLPAPEQPLRVVMGRRAVPPTSRVLDDAAPTLVLATRDPSAVLTELFERGRRHLFLEGGPTVAAAFLRAGLVDEVVAYVAPLLLGAGRSAVGDLGIESIAGALHLAVDDVTVLGDGPDRNLRLLLHPLHDGAPVPATPPAPTTSTSDTSDTSDDKDG